MFSILVLNEKKSTYGVLFLLTNSNIYKMKTKLTTSLFCLLLCNTCANN